MTFGTVTLLLLVALSGPATSDESLLAELREAHPETDIWPQIIECEDCYPIASGGPFAIGRWSVVDLECAEKYGTAGGSPPEDCLDFLKWTQSGVFHPAYHFRWTMPDNDEVSRVNSPVFVGDVSALFGRTKGPRLYLMQQDIYGPEYNLLEAQYEKDLIRKLTEYPLACVDAPKDSWERLGFRFHGNRSLSVWRDDYCEIRNLKGFLNLARRALKRKPVRVWEFTDESPEGADEPEQKEQGE